MMNDAVLKMMSEEKKPEVRQNWNMDSGMLPPEEVAEWIENIERIYGIQQASTFGEHDSKVRSSKIRWVTGDAYLTEFLFQVANQFAEKTGIHIYKNCEIQYTEYHASENGHYAMHHDVDWNRVDGLDRKLSVTFQLSSPEDYEGGDFIFEEIENPDPRMLRQLGTNLVFPSLHKHAVTPVTRGVRKSLVAWFYGPQWR